MAHNAQALEQQIVQALSGRLSAAAILELLERTEAAIEFTARAAAKQQAQSLDPQLSPDPEAAHNAMRSRLCRWNRSTSSAWQAG